MPPFHLAIPVDDLAAARAFYGDLLGCPEGRSADTWIDFNFFGHQLVVHQAPGRSSVAGRNAVDGDAVPVPHFGAVLTPDAFATLAHRLRTAGQRFEIEPHTRFAGEPGEQSTMFLFDPAGNALEFKAFADLGQLFARSPRVIPHAPPWSPDTPPAPQAHPRTHGRTSAPPRTDYPPRPRLPC
jgi:extradiol dioxygenase family protein